MPPNSACSALPKPCATKWPTRISACRQFARGGINTNIVRHARLAQGPNAEAEREEAIVQFQQLTRTQPDQAAQIILNGMRKNKPRILIGPDARLVDIIRRIFPDRYLNFLPFLKNVGRDNDAEA